MDCSNVLRLGRFQRIALLAAGLALASWVAQAQDTVKIGFLPLRPAVTLSKAFRRATALSSQSIRPIMRIWLSRLSP